MPRFKRLCLSIAGTASVALASLPLAIGPVSAARVPVGTTTSILILEASSNASQFNLGSHGAQDSSTELVGQTKNLYLITSQTTSISNVKKPPSIKATDREGKIIEIIGDQSPDRIKATDREGKPIGGNNGMERCPAGTVFATGNGGCGGGMPATKPTKGIPEKPTAPVNTSGSNIERQPSACSNPPCTLIPESTTR